MERSEGEVVAVVASFGGLSLAQGSTVRAVAPAPPAPVLHDRPPQAHAQPAASAVAFAPAAMSALIEAQERLSHPAAPILREQTTHKLDALITRIAGSPAPTDAALGVRQLEVARQALSLAPVSLGGIDLRA